MRLKNVLIKQSVKMQILTTILKVFINYGSPHLAQRLKFFCSSCHCFSALSPGSEQSTTPHVIYGAKQSPDSGYVSSRGLAALDSPGFSDNCKYASSTATAGNISDTAGSGPLSEICASTGAAAQQTQANATPSHNSVYSSTGCLAVEGQNDKLAPDRLPRTTAADLSLRYPSPNLSVATTGERKFMGETAGTAVHEERSFAGSVTPANGFGSSPQEPRITSAVSSSMASSGTGM